MDIRQSAQIIRDSVSMDDILGLYGYQPKHGFIRCPFHTGDRTASLKVYKGGKGWHCFGCGRGGSVIDFVMEHEGCDFLTAIRCIDSSMELGLSANTDPYKEEESKRIQRALDALEKAFMDAIDRIDREYDALIRYDFKQAQELEAIWVEDRTPQQWTRLDSLWDEMLWLEEKKTDCEKMREEVREWRRKSRKTGKAQ